MKLDQRYACVRKCLEQVQEVRALRQGRKKRHYHPPYSDFALDHSAKLRWPADAGVLACVELTIQPLDLVVQRYPDRRYDLQTSVFKDLSIRMLRLPLEDDAVAFNQKLFDLRPKQHDHGREPIIGMLDRFVIDLDHPSRPLNDWLTAMVVLFRPQIEELLIERDRVVLQWQAEHADTDVFEDRRLEIVSSIRISLHNQIEWLDRQLDAS